MKFQQVLKNNKGMAAILPIILVFAFFLGSMSLGIMMVNTKAQHFKEIKEFASSTLLKQVNALSKKAAEGDRNSHDNTMTGTNDGDTYYSTFHVEVDDYINDWVEALGKNAVRTGSNISIYDKSREKVVCEISSIRIQTKFNRTLQSSLSYNIKIYLFGYGVIPPVEKTVYIKPMRATRY